MTPLTFVLLSGGLSFGIPMALAVRELLLLTVSLRGGDEAPPEEHFAPAPRPLPDCLLPAPVSARNPLRSRVLEDA